ncbi:MAG: Cof-like hydrolase [Paenibacillus sp.]|jgi:Cof subfamily protein (haloacid dehalogenase superfamily)|nr:Cof-like hydrolase [Paenibacillus sp.]
MGKLVFFDIDGTLFDHEKRVPHSAKQAIIDLQNRGIEVAIATGRPPVMFKDVMNELGITTFVSCNGSYVVHRGEEVYTNMLQHEALQALETLAQDKGHPMLHSYHDLLWVNRENHPFVIRALNELRVRMPAFQPRLSRTQEVYYSGLYCEETEEAYVHEFPQFRIIRWHTQAIDILPAGGSKAQGIQKLLDLTGIKQEDTFAFGDGINDVEMLEFVGTGIAMGNACSEAKAAADLITRHVSDDGIRHGLEMVGLLK